MTITVQSDGIDVQIEPGEPDVKLFIVEGFTLKVEVCEDSDGNGWGIRYTTYIKDACMTPSVWFGDATIEDEEGVKNSPFQQLFDGMTQEQAEDAFKQLMSYAGGFIGRMAASRQK